MAGDIGRTAGQAVELWVLGEAPCDTLQEVVRIRAVVVGEGDEIGVHVCEGDIPGPREAPRGAQADDPEVRARCNEGQDAVVVVLVDEKHTEGAMGLALERVEQDPQSVAAVDCRDDESEGREVGILHRT